MTRLEALRKLLENEKEEEAARAGEQNRTPRTGSIAFVYKLIRG